MEDFDPNHPTPSPGLDDPSSGQSSISTQVDNDEESQYPIIETSPANPAPTDFPNYLNRSRWTIRKILKIPIITTL